MSNYYTIQNSIEAISGADVRMKVQIDLAEAGLPTGAISGLLAGSSLVGNTKETLQVPIRARGNRK